MSVGSVNFTGLGSGIDINALVASMHTVEEHPVTLMKSTVTNLQAQQTAYNTVSASLLGLQAAAFNVDSLRSFDLVTATPTDATVATITAATGAQTGTHAITVQNLAKSQIVSTAVQSSETTSLGFTGQIVINGKAINVNASDTLTTLASNINAAQPGVTASILSPSANQFYLTLSSSNSGVQGKIAISDTSGGSLLTGKLGMLTGTSAVSHTVTSGAATGAGSALFTDSATSIATLVGLTSPPAPSNVTITKADGTSGQATIDLTKSLSDIAASINNAGISGITAQVSSVTDPISNTTKQQLQILGAASFTDSNYVLSTLGVVQNQPVAGRELTAATDANFTIDTLPATRASNSFSDAVSGVTINLLKDGGASTSFTVAPDTTTIKTNIKAFVTAFNSAMDTIDSFSQYDATSGSTGALFGDSTVMGIVDSLVSSFTGVVSGLPSSMSSVGQIGISLDTTNHLSVDDAALSSALATNMNGVAQLFRAAGTSTNSNVQFVSGGALTQPSGAGGYAVNITQAASHATIIAAQKLVGTLAQDEAVTFGGGLFGTGDTLPLTGGHTITLHQGSSLTDIISQINGDAALNGSIVAGADPVTGALMISSNRYGSAADLAIMSAIPNSTGNTSGLDHLLLHATGQDIAGTINGEAATGNGQFLTGSQASNGSIPNGKALGLQLRVTATLPGNYGAMTFSAGVAETAKNYINTQTDGYTGMLTQAASAVGDSIKDMQSSITDLEARITDEDAALKAQYANMDAVVAQLKSAANGLTGLTTTATTK